MTKLRLAFMGTPDFAVPALEALIGAGHELVAVYSQPPRPAGRGHRVTKSPVQVLAEARHIPVLTPASLKSPDMQAEFINLDLDVAIVAAYGLILPKAILHAPRYGCLNIHGSLLPRWRGAAPIQRAILSGDTETGITIMAMEAGLDTGPMLIQESVPLTAATTTPMLYEQLASLGAQLIVSAVTGWSDGTLEATPQPEDGVLYADKLTREDGKLDWAQPALYGDRQVRALNPWPGAWFDCQGERIKVGAVTVSSAKGASGTILTDDFTVACGEGALTLQKLQRPGRSWVDGATFLRAHNLKAGDRL